MAKKAVLILTHFLNQHITDMFQRLYTEAPPDHDVFLGLNTGKEPLQLPEEGNAFRDKIYLTNSEKLMALPYPEKCRREGWSGKGWNFNGNADILVLAFAHDHPEYDYIWAIEYDVHYEGNWGFLFKRFEDSRADLLGTTLDNAMKMPIGAREMPPPLRKENGARQDFRAVVAGFFPVLRVSRRLLEKVDESYRKGWGGHYELTLGTIAKRYGLDIEDIGGNGPYVKPHNRNAFYFNTISTWGKFPGTFIFRPNIVKILKRKNTLWHPVKPKGSYFNHCPPSEENSLYLRARNFVKSIFHVVVVYVWFAFFWRPAAGR